MYIRILLGLAAVATLLWLLRWFLRNPPAKVRRHLIRGVVAAGIGVLILLAVTGRLHWLFALGAFLLARAGRLLSLLNMLPLLRRVGGACQVRRGARRRGGGQPAIPGGKPLPAHEPGPRQRAPGRPGTGRAPCRGPPQ
jgi:hypothetical protein